MAEANRPLTWDDIVDAYRKISTEMSPYQATIIGPAVWADLLARSSEAECRALEMLRANGSVIISPHLPNGVAGYRYTPDA